MTCPYQARSSHIDIVDRTFKGHSTALCRASFTFCTPPISFHCTLGIYQESESAKDNLSCYNHRKCFVFHRSTSILTARCKDGWQRTRAGRKSCIERGGNLAVAVVMNKENTSSRRRIAISDSKKLYGQYIHRIITFRSHSTQ